MDSDLFKNRNLADDEETIAKTIIALETVIIFEWLSQILTRRLKISSK